MVAFFTPAVLLKRAGAASVAWNPADASGMNFSNANLTATNNTTPAGVRALSFIASGKRYFEVYVDSGSNNRTAIGVSTSAQSLSSNPGINDSLGACYDAGGNIWYGFGGQLFGSTFTGGDTIGVAVDFPNHLIYFAKNNTWQVSGNPAAGTGGINYVTTNQVAPSFHMSGGVTSQVTLKTATTLYTPPSGFTAGLA